MFYCIRTLTLNLVNSTVGQMYYLCQLDAWIIIIIIPYLSLERFSLSFAFSWMVESLQSLCITERGHIQWYAKIYLWDTFCPCIDSQSWWTVKNSTFTHPQVQWNNSCLPNGAQEPNSKQKISHNTAFDMFIYRDVQNFGKPLFVSREMNWQMIHFFWCAKQYWYKA